MKILFLTLSHIKSIEDRGIYTDLLREFRNKRHQVTIVTPAERRLNIKTNISKVEGIKLLQVKTLNITKCHFIEKGIATLAIEFQYLRAIKKYLKGIKFDLVLYSTPPITFERVIKYIKSQSKAYSYLLLKDIFPQNAVDMKMIRKGSLIHMYFERKEKKLYDISDTIGCMSPANVEFLLKNNPSININKVEVNPNSISPLHIKYTLEEKKEIKTKFGLPLDKKIFVYGGNLGIPQGIDFLIETLEELKEPKAYVLIVGSGTQFTKLDNWFKTHKPTNSTLLSGLPKVEYDTLLAACDIGLIFLHKDFTIPNFPSRLLTYLEMKKPVLAATDVNTDMGRIIEKAECGYWVESGDNKTIQDKISQLCRDDLTTMGENGWNLLKKEYLITKSYNLIKEKVNV
ncbi:MAG: glycosyltransferase family 4 protein [Bacteroidales bacterium]|nr:glycosyltransferase family 4 protein [Bacteroidales bacterium]